MNSVSTGTTVILVRHADIDLPPSATDPPLNAAGRERAIALAHTAASAEPASIFTSPFLRTRQTAAPLADRLGVTPLEAPPPGVLIPQLLAAGQDRTTLIVGHSNTVPQIIVALGAAPEPPIIGEQEFDHLFVVTLHPIGAARMVHLRYGAAGMP